MTLNANLFVCRPVFFFWKIFIFSTFCVFLSFPGFFTCVYLRADKLENIKLAQCGAITKHKSRSHFSLLCFVFFVLLFSIFRYSLEFKF